MTIACGGEAAGRRPGPARRIVEFRARENAAVTNRLRRAPCRWAATSPCDYRRAVARLPVAVQVPLRRIVEFRARKIPRSNHLRRAPCRWAATSPWVIACGGEAAGHRPGPARRIVEFRARRLSPSAPPPATNTGRWAARSPCDQIVWWRDCRWRHPSPLFDGSYSSALAKESSGITHRFPLQQDLAVGQQGRRVTSSCRTEATRNFPESRSSDHRVPRSRKGHCYHLLPPSAPCRWAARSPCAHRESR